MATATMTVFLRTGMHHNSVIDGGIYAGALFFGNLVVMFNGFADLATTIARLPVFYKQRDLLFYPSWAYALPTWILKIPITFAEAAAWTFLTYYVIGYSQMFVEEVMELVELNSIRDAYVGLPGITGLSTEQRKRLTIAVELVANPSIIFMDEPTSGLDARAAGDICCRRNKALIEELSTPSPSSKDLEFPSKYSRSFSVQCMACLWKQHCSYWRNPYYNFMRFFFTFAVALLLGGVYSNIDKPGLSLLPWQPHLL